MSVAQTYENYAQLAGTLGTYPGAESALFAIAGPLAGNFMTLFYEFVYVVMLAVLGWRLVMLDMGGIVKAFLSLIVVAVLLYPVQVSVPKVSREVVKQQGPFSALATAKLTAGGGMSLGRCGGDGCITLPAAVYVVNYVSTLGMRLGMAAVDDVFGSASSEPGQFGAVSYQLINSDDRIEELARGSGVAGAMQVYRDVCSRITRETDPMWQNGARIRPLTEEELAAVGLAEDKKMPMIEVNESVRQSALRELAKWPRDGFSLELPHATRNWYPRFKIESRAYWLGTVGDSKQAATYLVAPPELRSQITYRDGELVTEEVHAGAPEYFYPQNCADLYKTIQLGIQEFRAATELRFSKMRAERKISDEYDSAGYKSTKALAKAIGGLQEAGGGSGVGAALSKIPLIGWLVGIAESSGIMTLAKLVQGVTEFVGKWIVLFMPGAAALAVLMAAIYYPIVSFFALLPYQLGRVSSVFWFIVWIKLALLMVYVSLKLAGAVSLELAKAELVQATDAAVYGLMVVTTVGAMILVLKSPFWAHSIVFDDKHGLAHSVSKFGGGVVAGAAMMAARPASRMVAMAAKPALKIAGTGLRGAGRMAASAYRGWHDGAGLGAAGRTTMKQLQDRISQMRRK